jgi:hypothetical protein
VDGDPGWCWGSDLGETLKGCCRVPRGLVSAKTSDMAIGALGSYLYEGLAHSLADGSARKLG